MLPGASRTEPLQALSSQDLPLPRDRQARDCSYLHPTRIKNAAGVPGRSRDAPIGQPWLERDASSVRGNASHGSCSGCGGLRTSGPWFRSIQATRAAAGRHYLSVVCSAQVGEPESSVHGI